MSRSVYSIHFVSKLNSILRTMYRDPQNGLFKFYTVENNTSLDTSLSQ